MKMKHLLYGAAYYHEYMPYDRLDTDMQLMKRNGMNVIRIAESTWSTLEPADGVFDFTHLNRMLGAAAKYGIQVIIGTPTYAVPTWLVKKHPDILAITHNGQELYGRRQNMDITNPHYRKYAERMICQLMEHIKDQEHIIGFQLDNETKSYDTAGPNVQAAFVNYLQKQFADIHEMNQAFGLDFWSNRINTWEDFPDIRGTINGSLGAEFQKFQRLLVRDFLHWQAEIIDRYRREDQFITHNFDYDWRDYSFGIQPEVNQFETAAFMDIPGVDIYHPSQDDLTGAEIAFGGAVGRGLKKSNYLVLETQSQGNLSWLPYEGQLRLQAYSHLSSGANSLLYWNWHSIHNSFETYWKGVLSHDLEENYIYRETVQIGAEIARIGDKLVNLRKKCDVAIMVSNESLTGLQWFPISRTLAYNDVVRWLYDTFYRLNIECDIISSEDTHLQDYPVLVVPAMYSAADETLKRIDAYVAAGGHLLTTFKTAFADEYIKVAADIQPHILHTCLGVTYQHFTVPQKVSLSGSILKSNPAVTEWMELLVPDTAAVWASYEHPHWGKYAAVTHNRYQEGSATYLGCYFDGNTLEDIIRQLWTEIGLPLSDFQFPLIHKSGINDDGKQIDYYLNYSEADISLTLDSGYRTELLSGIKIKNGESISVKPWNLVILEY